MIGESRRYEASVDPMMAAEATAWQAKRDQWQHARRAQERRLFGRLAVDRSPATRAAIVEQFLPLARQLARRYRNLEDIEDLEQIAAMGLVKAIDRFDPQRGLAFSSFAFPTILGELKRHLRDRGWCVRPPRSVQELAARVEPAANAIHAERGRSPTVPELAERVGSTVEQVLEAMQLATARRAISLDEPRWDADKPAGRGREVAFEEPGFAIAEDAAVLDELMRGLTERERRVVRLRFREDLRQSQIGDLLGMSQMQVSRMLRNTLAQLQETVTSTPSSASARRLPSSERRNARRRPGGWSK
jgi:RNA polymerase sigma-B factor